MYDPVFILNVKTVITAANVVLLVLLLAMYIQSYHRIKSKFTLGLMIFASFLLLQAVILTPCIAAACGRQMCVVGPLDVIPEILEFMALLVLLYLSSE
jgi:hypothetical protein